MKKIAKVILVAISIILLSKSLMIQSVSADFGDVPNVGPVDQFSTD